MTRYVRRRARCSRQPSLWIALAVAAMLATCVWPRSSALAQSRSVANGAARVASADFEGAIAILVEALGTETMSRDDAELALDRIAAAQLAIGDERGLERTLAHLALVAPRHQFGPDLPAILGEQLAATARRVSPVRLRIVAVLTSPTGAAIRAVVSADRWRAIRNVELTCAWRDGEDATVAVVPRMSVPSSSTCTAVARGPGGVPLARARRAGEGMGSDDTGTSGRRDAGGGSIESGWVVAGIGGAVLLVGAVIAIGVAASSGGDESSIDLRGPTVMGW